MKAVFKMEMLKHAQDKGLYFWTFILPIIFIVLFISIFTASTDAEINAQVIISIVPGYTVMFCLFILISMAVSFIEDANRGMVARLASTPLPPYAYLLGKWAPFIMIVLIQIIVLFTFGKIVYNIPLNQPFLLSILAFVLTLSITGMGLALSLLIRSGNMGVAITQVVALGGALLGGLWMPLEMMPNVFQKISKLTPQYWAHDAFQDAMVGTLNLSDFLLASSVLLSFGCIGFVIAWVTYPTFLQRAKN